MKLVASHEETFRNPGRIFGRRQKEKAKDKC